jgi:Mn2+/Fe2+ NRAMP family transporter
MPPPLDPAEPATLPQRTARPGIKECINALGPGIVSGASDNDPTTVGTLAVVGSTTVYGLSWLTILIYPMLASIQITSARVGVVTHRTLQQLVRRQYRTGWSLLFLVAVLAVNLITVGADLEAGAAALGLLIPIPWRIFVVPYALVLFGLLLFGSYRHVERVLRYVLLVFVVYAAAAFLAHPDWGTVLSDTVIPHLSRSSAYIQGALSLLGTTLTSYVYVWETIEVAEERPPITHLGLAQADAGIGMFVAVATFWFILIATGATLGVHHQTVQTAQDAARALEPAAGRLASVLFGIGLLASSVLAVPVLAATSAYVLGQQFGWRTGLSEMPWRARSFYIAMGAVMLVAVAISLLGFSAIDLLFWSSIAGGLGTPITLVFLLLLARDRSVMGEFRIGRLLTTIGWGTATLITVISGYFLWQELGSVL